MPDTTADMTSEPVRDMTPRIATAEIVTMSITTRAIAITETPDTVETILFGNSIATKSPLRGAQRQGR